MQSPNSGKSHRRKKHGRAPPNPRRRKHKKDTPVDNSSIEEQLRVQRKKQKAIEKNSKQPPRATLGNYVYDSERQAYFPADSIPKKEAAVQQNNDDDKNERNYLQLSRQRHALDSNMESTSCQSIRYSMEVSNSSRRQQDLRSLWSGRLLKMGMTVVPTVAQSTDRTHLLSMLLSLQNHNELQTTALDLGCKSRLHPSARTFDIHMGIDHDKLPSIATLVDGGSNVRFAHCPHLWRVGDQPSEMQEALSLGISPVPGGGEPEPHAIRFAPTEVQAPDDFCFANVCRSLGPEKNIFRLWQGGDGVIDRHEIPLPMNVNDFCFDPINAHGVIGVAASYSKKHGFGPVVIDMEREGSHHHIMGRYPKSDALCIEYLADSFLIGHRNGSISLADTRLDQVSTHGQVDGAGSVTAIAVVDGGPTFLTKHSFGSCCLWDVRYMGTDSSVAPVRRLQVPSHALHPTKSSYCNGIALDPTQNIAISPFVNIRGRPCLAMWSLSSGSYVGSRELTCENLEVQQESSVMPHCELSSTITSAWKPISDQGDGDAMEPEKGAWGLWFKSGAPVGNGPAPPTFVGSIHHVSFPGRMDSLREVEHELVELGP